MTNLTDKQIEDAFARIRVKFEKRKNETGLEILDGYEGQWEATGSLSTAVGLPDDRWGETTTS